MVIIMCPIVLIALDDKTVSNIYFIIRTGAVPQNIQAECYYDHFLH